MKQLLCLSFFLFNISMAYGQALGFIGTDTTTLTNSPTLSRLAFKDDNLYRIRNTRPAILIAASEYNLTNLVGVTGKIKVTNGTGAVQGTTPVILTFSDTLIAEARLETPLLVGGTGASRVLTVQSTLDAGTTDAISFKTGSQVERMRIGTSGAIRFNNYTSGFAKFDGSGNITSGTISSGDIPSLSATYLSLASGGTVNAGVVATSLKSPTAIIENRKNGSEIDRYTWRLANNGTDLGQSLALDWYSENSLFNTNNPNILYIKDGLIGVNKTNPTYAFDITGNLRVTSNIRFQDLTKGLVKSDSSGNLSVLYGSNTNFVKADGSLDPTTYLSTSAAGALYALLSGAAFTGKISTTDSVRVGKAIVIDKSIPAGTTTRNYFRSVAQTDNSVSPNTIRHLSVEQGILGSGSTINNHYGVSIDDLTGTNVYGVYSAISSTSKYFLYGGGAAKSYFNGRVGIGTTSPTEKLHVSGNIKGDTAKFVAIGGRTNVFSEPIDGDYLLVASNTAIANGDAPYTLTANGNIGADSTFTTLVGDNPLTEITGASVYYATQKDRVIVVQSTYSSSYIVFNSANGTNGKNLTVVNMTGGNITINDETLTPLVYKAPSNTNAVIATGATLRIVRGVSSWYKAN